MDFRWGSGSNPRLGSYVKRLFMMEERVLSLEEFKKSKVFMDLTLLEFKEVIECFRKREIYS